MFPFGGCQQQQQQHQLQQQFLYHNNGNHMGMENNCGGVGNTSAFIHKALNPQTEQVFHYK
jgi:hypothetical protein